MLADLTNPVWIVFIFILLPPAVLWLRRKLCGKKTPVNVVVDCPHCHCRIGLDRFRNFICAECNGTVVLTKGRKSDEPSDDWPRYICPACQAENIQPVRFCLNCHEPRPEPGDSS